MADPASKRDHPLHTQLLMAAVVLAAQTVTLLTLDSEWSLLVCACSGWLTGRIGAELWLGGEDG